MFQFQGFALFFILILYHQMSGHFQIDPIATVIKNVKYQANFSVKSTGTNLSENESEILKHKEMKMNEAELKTSHTSETSESLKLTTENVTKLQDWWSEQGKIQEKVREVCQKYSGVLGREINPAMFSYSEQYNLLYCRNQKVILCFVSFPDMEIMP